MRRNWELEDLGISQGEFEAPEELNIVVDCDPKAEKGEEPIIDLTEDDIEDIGF